MKRTFRVALVLWVFASTLSLISTQNATAVSANPSPVCSGATCTVTFTYTGDFYSWNAPLAGSFTFETWGAQGGNAEYNSSVLTAGGLGGYAKGTKTLTSGQTLYIYVGGQGASSGNGINKDQRAGGFNGGGFGFNGDSSVNRGSGGGGATDVRVDTNSLSSRVIVGGGGGGGVYFSGYGTNYPGVGGGTLGGDGGTAQYPNSTHSGKGGTQSTGGAGGANGNTANSGALGLGGSASAAYGYGEGGGGAGYYGGGGSGTGMGSGGGSGYVGGVSTTTLTSGANVMPNPSGGTMTGKTGNGVARITYPNGPTISQFTPQTTLTNSSTISYSLVFSENVTGLAAADFTVSGTGSSTCVIGTPSGSNTTYTVALSGCSPGTVILTLAINSVSNASSQTGPSAATAAATVNIDQTGPTIASVSAPANSTYSNNQTPTFTMVFSESVTVTGTPRLTLTVGSSTKYANFLALNDSKTATFRYTVTSDSNEYDTDGISVATSVDLNGGSISDFATNTISNLTFTAPTLTSVFVAQQPVAPTIDSVVATSGTLTIYFTAGDARGSTTSGYQYTTDNNTFKNRETGTLASPLVITTVSTGAAALVNGAGYRLRIRAVTNAGNSAISNLVNETPTAVSVLGDSTLGLTYGSSASTGAYSATGGTNTYTWSLGSSLTGITLSGTTVTASSSTPAGTYSQTVRATDGNSQVGTKSLTITVNKASTSISIALPGAATNAALGGAVTITATVPRAGAVNFMFGGTTISGCGSASAASTTAICSWTPNALGSVSLTATFTPTDSSNFETSTTTTLSITVVNGVSTVALSLTGGTTTPPKGQAINIIAAVDQAGRITFMIDGKRIPGCNNKVANVGNVMCSWKPAIQKETTITARLVPTNNVYNASSSSLKVRVVRRSGLR